MLLRRAALAALLVCCGSPLSAAPRLRLTTLVEGVHLVAPADGADRDRTNAVVVEQEAGLLVINAQPSPEGAREMLALLGASLPRRKVRYLAIAHPHADAAAGASAFPPDTLVIASEGVAERLADPAHDFGAEARERAGEGYVEPPRPRIGLRLQGSVLLDDAKHPVTLSPLAPGHSPGDLLVDVPSADLVAVGSLLFGDRNPWAGSAQLGGWIAHLNNLAASGRKTFVPLQGPAADTQEIRRQREALAWVRGEVDAAFVDRTPPAEIPARVLASPRAASYFDLQARPAFARGVVAQAVVEAQGQRRKFGLER